MNYFVDLSVFIIKNKSQQWKKITTNQRNTLSTLSYIDRDELDNLDIPYKFRDFCQEDYADYISCVRTRPRVFENPFIYTFPFS